MHLSTRCAVIAATIAVLCHASVPAAQADDETYTKHDWPLESILRPLTLADSMLEIRGDTLQINLSKDSAGDPVAIAPDLFFGVNDKLTVGLTNQIGFCVAGDVCDKPFNDLGIEALYGLMQRGSFQVAGRGGIIMPRLSDNFTLGVLAGLRTRLTVSKVAIVIDPSVYVGILETDIRDHGLEVPVEIQYQLNTQTMVYLLTGIAGTFESFGDVYSVPLGLGANFAVNERLDFGAEFRFDNALGNDTVFGETFDQRWFVLRAALRL